MSGWVAALGAIAFTQLSIAPALAQNAQPQWPMPAGDFSNTRFSPLEDVTPSNVASLKLSFSFSTGFLRGHEAAPIVTTDTMYIVTPYPNVLFALALDKPGAPVKWQYEPKPRASSQGVACCDTVNRGAAYD